VFRPPAAPCTPADKRISVTFKPGQLAPETTVTFDEHADAPPPLAGFRPLAPAFDIRLDHPAAGGTVTVGYTLAS
jgi:hypothetical protein